MPTNLNWKNIISRAIWTFLQGAIGTVTILPYLTDAPGWQNVLNGAIAGGVAALVSLLKTIAQESLSPSAEPVPVARHLAPN